MKDLILTLKQIDDDFYRGIYTVGERYDLIKSIEDLLSTKKFIR
ncbi:MAG: hypothetical protein ABF246_11570 [Winogradskyella sp.]|jgi:hypothetical protein